MKPEDFGIYEYKFNSDGTLDVFQNVNLQHKHLTELPFKFGKVDGIFNCNGNNLKSLKGAPKVVNGNFYCSDNKLTSLKGAPKVVYGYFSCRNNNLTSLEGLNLDGISGKIYIKRNPDLKLTEKEEFWMTLNPGRLLLK